MNNKNQKTKTVIFVILLLIISVFLRVWRLEKVPASLTGDELAFSYNALSLWETGKDEYGIPWPSTFKSFGDYKVPLPVYFQIPFVALWGLNEWSIRLPVTLISSLIPLLVYLITMQLLNLQIKNNTKVQSSSNTSDEKIINHHKSVAFIAGLLIAISPWHIHFSRGAWEANLAIFFTLLGMYMLFLNSKKYLLTVSAAISLGLAMYSYHASRVYVPLLLIWWLFIYNWNLVQNIIQKKPSLRIPKLLWNTQTKKTYLVLLIFTVISLPAFTSLTNISGNSRFVSSTVGKFIESPTFIEKIKNLKLDSSYFQQFPYHLYFSLNDISAKFYAYFSPAQIFVWGDVVGRHGVADMGRLIILDFVLFIFAFKYLVQNSFSRIKLFLLGWLVIGAIPGAITQDEYHSIRSLMMVVPLSILFSLGIDTFRHSVSKPARYIVIGTGTIIYAYLFIIYSINYHYVTAVERAETYQYGMKQLVAIISPIAYKYKEIVIETPVLYGHPYIHLLSHLQYDPAKYQQTANRADNTNVIPPVAEVYGFDKYTFRNINWSDDQKKGNTLFVGPPFVLPDKKDIRIDQNIKFVDEVLFPTGNVAMRIIEVN